KDITITCAFGFTPQEAIDNLKDRQKNMTSTKLQAISIADNDSLLDVAYTHAQHSLNQLCVYHGKKQGIFAGYPWFYQWWTRDEAISLGALFVQKKYDIITQILWRQLEGLCDD